MHGPVMWLTDSSILRPIGLLLYAEPRLDVSFSVQRQSGNACLWHAVVVDTFRQPTSLSSAARLACCPPHDKLCH